MNLGSILIGVARICVGTAAATFAILSLARGPRWSACLSGRPSEVFVDGTASDLLFWSSVASEAIIGAMIGSGTILVDPQKKRANWAASPSAQGSARAK
jgi:hypothetical protein